MKLIFRHFAPKLLLSTLLLGPTDSLAGDDLRSLDSSRLTHNLTETPITPISREITETPQGVSFSNLRKKATLKASKLLQVSQLYLPMLYGLYTLTYASDYHIEPGERWTNPQHQPWYFEIIDAATYTSIFQFQQKGTCPLLDQHNLYCPETLHLGDISRCEGTSIERHFSYDPSEEFHCPFEDYWCSTNDDRQYFGFISDIIHNETMHLIKNNISEVTLDLYKIRTGLNANLHCYYNSTSLLTYLQSTGKLPENYTEVLYNGFKESLDFLELTLNTKPIDWLPKACTKIFWGLNLWIPFVGSYRLGEITSATFLPPVNDTDFINKYLLDNDHCVSDVKHEGAASRAFLLATKDLPLMLNGVIFVYVVHLFMTLFFS